MTIPRKEDGSALEETLEEVKTAVEEANDMANLSVGRGGFTSNPTVKSVDNSTGAKIGPLALGRHRLKASDRVYFLQGASAITAADVLVNEATPSTSHPIFTSETVEVDVTGATDNYIALKTYTGTALVWQSLMQAAS